MLSWRGIIISINMNDLSMHSLRCQALVCLEGHNQENYDGIIIPRISILSWTLRVISSWVQHADRRGFFVSQRPIQFILWHVGANRIFKKSVYYQPSWKPQLIWHWVCLEQTVIFIHQTDYYTNILKTLFPLLQRSVFFIYVKLKVWWKTKIWQCGMWSWGNIGIPLDVINKMLLIW